MSVSMSLKNRHTGEFRDVPLGSLRGFNEHWLPACERLGLVWVPHFSGGALTVVPDELIGPILQELCQLRLALLGAEQLAWIVERIDSVLAAFAETNAEEWEYSFG